MHFVERTNCSHVFSIQLDKQNKFTLAKQAKHVSILTIWAEWIQANEQCVVLPTKTQIVCLLAEHLHCLNHGFGEEKKARVYHQDASDAAPFRPPALGGFSGACIPSGNIVFASAASGDKEPTHHRELLARTAVKMITSTCKRNNSNNSLLRFLLPFFRRLESLGSKAIYKAL